MTCFCIQSRKREAGRITRHAACRLIIRMPRKSERTGPGREFLKRRMATED